MSLGSCKELWDTLEKFQIWKLRYPQYKLNAENLRCVTSQGSIVLLLAGLNKQSKQLRIATVFLWRGIKPMQLILCISILWLSLSFGSYISSSCYTSTDSYRQHPLLRLGAFMHLFLVCLYYVLGCYLAFWVFGMGSRILYSNHNSSKKFQLPASTSQDVLKAIWQPWNSLLWRIYI